MSVAESFPLGHPPPHPTQFSERRTSNKSALNCCQLRLFRRCECQKILGRLSKTYRSVFLYDGGKRRRRYHNICSKNVNLRRILLGVSFFLCFTQEKNILCNLLIIKVIRLCLSCGKNLLRIFFHCVADGDTCIFALTMHAANQSRQRQHNDQTVYI